MAFTMVVEAAAVTGGNIGMMNRGLKKRGRGGEMDSAKKGGRPEGEEGA